MFNEADFLTDMGTNFTNFYKETSKNYKEEEIPIVTYDIDKFFKDTLSEDYNKKISNAFLDIERIQTFSLNDTKYSAEEVREKNDSLHSLLGIENFSEAENIIQALTKDKKYKNDDLISTILAVLLINKQDINTENYTDTANIATISNYLCSFYQSNLAENNSLFGYPIGILMVINPKQIQEELKVNLNKWPQCSFDTTYVLDDDNEDNFFNTTHQGPNKHKRDLFIKSSETNLLVVHVFQYIICLNNKVKIVAVLVTMIFDFTKNKVIKKYKYTWNPRYETSAGSFFKEFFDIMKNVFDDSSSSVDKKQTILEFYFKTLSEFSDSESKSDKNKLNNIIVQSKRFASKFKGPSQNNVSEIKGPSQSFVSEIKGPSQSFVSENTGPQPQNNVSENTGPQPQNNVSENTGPQSQSFVSEHKKTLGGLGLEALVIGGIVSAAIMLSGGKTKKKRRHSNRIKKNKKSINRARKTHKRKRNPKGSSLVRRYGFKKKY